MIFILKLIGWAALLFLGISFFPTVIDVFVKYKQFDRDGTFKAAKRGKHHLDKETYVRKAAIILTIQLILVVVLFYLLVIRY
ncbi:MAG: hypothetical protein HPY50_14985 [Firmicutes bacterium]|nr:hypothetical protein [Bacillota bacterium]